MSTQASPPHPVAISNARLRRLELPQPTSAWARWLHHGGDPETAGHAHAHTRPWLQVLWLTGVDYFSTLGYQPGIALIAAGAISPIATLILVLVTLFGALPIYSQVAARSYIGQGSIAMLEELLTGWKSKLFVLVLIGFAATDFVITMTLSAADAAQHLVENPIAKPYLHGAQMGVTLIMLALLAAVFLKGFGEAIGVAVAIGIPYIALNLIVIGRCFVLIAQHPETLGEWQRGLALKGDWTGLLVMGALIFPKLALGMSGFETGVAVMPLVRGEASDADEHRPHGRIRNTRKLLATAAVMMSALLLMTSFATTLLVPAEAYHEHGPASGRVLAYLCHELMGHAWGTVYDLSTVLILWFAGASAMAGMLNLIPRYLPRLGMAPKWVAYARPLVLILFAIDVLVTLVFRADVEAQGGAYATGVLALMFSAAVAVTLSLHREAGHDGRRGRRGVVYFGIVSLVFLYTLGQNIHERPDGVIIASIFIVCIMALSALSRYLRATELRVEGLTLEDDASAALWDQLHCKKVNLVPLKHFDEASIEWKSQEIRRHYRVDGPLAFLHVRLRDDRSDFAGVLRVRVTRHREQDFIIEVHGAVALANAIAYISELIDPISIFLGLTRQNSVSQAFRYLLWGEGETGILVYEILRRHWDWTPEEDVRPLIYIMSE